MNEDQNEVSDQRQDDDDDQVVVHLDVDHDQVVHVDHDVEEGNRKEVLVTLDQKKNLSDQEEVKKLDSYHTCSGNRTSNVVGSNVGSNVGLNVVGSNVIVVDGDVLVLASVVVPFVYLHYRTLDHFQEQLIQYHSWILNVTMAAADLVAPDLAAADRIHLHLAVVADTRVLEAVVEDDGVHNQDGVMVVLDDHKERERKTPASKSSRE